MGNRIYYACQAVELNGPSGNTEANSAYDAIHGLQSIGINTNFNLEPIYQLGQLEVYDDYEEMPEVEISLNKVLDGYPTIFSMAMGTGNIRDISDNRTSVRLSLFPDTSGGASQGAPTSQVVCAPAYISQVTYNFPTEGNFTEEVTIVSNSKVWASSPSTITGTRSANPSYGILRRGQLNKSATVYPTGDNGAYSSGSLPSGCKVQDLKISVNLGREQLRELGSRQPYLRYVNYPLEITTEITVLAKDGGDLVGVSDAASSCTIPKALKGYPIKVALCDGTQIDLGKNNKLTSVNFQGGDTGGGNATLTYSYRTFNDFIYTAPTGTAYSTVVESSLPTGSALYF